MNCVAPYDYSRFSKSTRAEFGTMGNLLNRVYAKFANPGLLLVANKEKLDFEWVIEAGCHNGSDTLKFLDLPNVRKVYAFEPDAWAADIAEAKFNSHRTRVELKRLALMDQTGFVEICSPTGRFGDGSSTVGQFKSIASSYSVNSKVIRCTTLDRELQNLVGCGLLWLDVEGSAAQVLTGAFTVLEKVKLIQVEVELHSSRRGFANFAKVHWILTKTNFSILYAPLHPGFFGDAVYVKTNQMTVLGKIRSLLLEGLYLLLHLIIYPLIGKPKT